MIKQVFHVETYWEVRVWYNLDFDLFPDIADELLDNGISKYGLRELYYMMYSGLAKAVTFSNLNLHISIVLFNSHKDRADYMDSIVHEAEHIKQAMLHAYQVIDQGEPPAYTIGYLVRRMYKVFKGFLCK